MDKKLLFLFPCLMFVVCGCETIATREDVGKVESEVSTVKEDFHATSRSVAQKIRQVESEMAEKDASLSERIDNLSREKTALSEEISSINQRLNELQGKIEELNYAYNRKLEELKESSEEDSLAVRRDTGQLKKTYNDLVYTTSTLNKNITDMHKDIVALNTSYSQIAAVIKKLSEDIQNNNKENAVLKDRIDKNTKVFLNELTRQESEIQQLKASVGKFKSQIEEGEIIITGQEQANSYTVKKGDYLIKIANKFNTSVKAIQQANKLKDTNIYPGQKLLIP
jgi:LysM repeat protein